MDKNMESKYREIVHSDDFYARLTAIDPEDTDAWRALLWHIGKRVRRKLTSRPKPPDLTDKEAVDEYVQGACEIVLACLDQVREPARFIKWLDQVIQTALASLELKGLLEALNRLFEKAGSLPAEHQHALHELIRQRPPEERAVLYLALQGERFRGNAKRQWLWYQVRRELIRDAAFLQFLRDLAQEGVSQAKTVLEWKNKWETRTVYLSEATEDEDGEQDRPRLELADEETIPPPELLEQKVERQALLECLERLRQKSEKQYQTIVRHYLYEEPFARIKDELQAARPATPRKWHERGLQALRDCLNSKHLMPERGTR